MEHEFLTHENCQKDICPICDGGLAICSVCGAIEGELTTECPGYKLTPLERDAVFNALSDYKNGKWCSL